MGKQLGTIQTTGIGKPDYTNDVSMGQIRPGLTLKYRQTLKLFGLVPSNIISPFPYVVPPIAPGATQNLIDFETGLPMPYTIPIGYFASLVQIGIGLNQDYTAPIYIDTVFAGYLSTGSAGDPKVWSEVTPFSTLSIDPTGATFHLYDCLLENLGGANMMGAISIYAILEELGTPPLPTTKVLRCKFCGYEWEVQKETTSITCPSCGRINIYCDFSKYRGTS